MFNLRGIGKTLPKPSAGGDRDAVGSRGRPKTARGKRRSALRGAIAAAALQGEDDLCAALRSTGLRTQLVLMAPEVTTACVMLSPEHLPLPPGARVHFRLESERIAPRAAMASLVVASVGTVANSADRPMVVTSRADPSGGSCEVVVLNSGDEAILSSFSVRFTVFRTAASSVAAPGAGSWVLRDGVRMYSCADCRQRKPQDEFARQNPSSGRRNYRQTLQCDDCVAAAPSAPPASVAETLQRQPCSHGGAGGRRGRSKSEQDLEAIESAEFFDGPL